MQYYSIAQVAEIISCSKGNVKNLITSGKLKSYKIGKLVRVEKVDLEEFLANAKNKN